FNGIKLSNKITITVACEGKTDYSDYEIDALHQDSVSILLPENTGLVSTWAQITVVSGNQKWTDSIIIPAKKQWTVYIYPHSHVDIGYTNLQDVVQKLHERNIDVAIDIAKKTQSYPDGAKFIWNPEATWVVSSY